MWFTSHLDRRGEAFSAMSQVAQNQNQSQGSGVRDQVTG
jgi:hypothetical protein